MNKLEWMPENPWDKKCKSECSLSDYDRYFNSAEDWSDGSITTAKAILEYLIAWIKPVTTTNRIVNEDEARASRTVKFALEQMLSDLEKMK